MIDELESICKVVAYSKYCLGICLRWLNKTTENLNYDSWCPVNDLNPALPGYQSGVLLLQEATQYLVCD
jgi:hypothetical protein